MLSTVAKGDRVHATRSKSEGDEYAILSIPYRFIHSNRGDPYRTTFLLIFARDFGLEIGRKSRTDAGQQR